MSFNAVPVQTASGVPARSNPRLFRASPPEKTTSPFFVKNYFTEKNNTPFIVTACYNLILKPAYVKFPTKLCFFVLFFLFCNMKIRISVSKSRKVSSFRFVFHEVQRLLYPNNKYLLFLKAASMGRKNKTPFNCNEMSTKIYQPITKKGGNAAKIQN